MILSPWEPSLSCEPYNAVCRPPAMPFCRAAPPTARDGPTEDRIGAKILLTKRPLKNIIKRKKAIKIEN
jgi:hypothetical protein